MSIQLQSDQTELKGLLEQAKRPRVRVVLQNELSIVDAKINEIERQRLQDDVACMESDDKENPSTHQSLERREGRVQRTKITSYGKKCKPMSLERQGRYTYQSLFSAYSTLDFYDLRSEFISLCTFMIFK